MIKSINRNNQNSDYKKHFPEKTKLLLMKIEVAVDALFCFNRKYMILNRLY